MRLGIMALLVITASAGAQAGPAHTACGSNLAARDTARFVGIPRSNRPAGSLRLWTDTAGRLAYSETWRIGSDTILWDGSITLSNAGARAYTARRLRNGQGASETAELIGDSLIVRRDTSRNATAVRHGVVPLPGLLSAPIRMLLIQCALQNANHRVETSRFGELRAESVASTTIRSGPRTRRVRLYLLRTNGDEVAGRAWVDEKGDIIAYPAAEGEMDLLRPEWVSSRDHLVEAEVRASMTCLNGGCAAFTRVCNLATSTTTSPARVASMVITDSGYTIRSDGRGPYRNGANHVLLGPVGIIAGLIVSSPRGDTARAFVVDLNHPVRGDIGKPLGVIRVDGHFRGRFVPSDEDTSELGPAGRGWNALLAHANTDWDETQHSLAETPVGGVVSLSQLNLDFYLHGVLRVLQMGPQPYYHCSSAGTAVYGDGTTMGTLSHPDASHWVVNLPPGSVGRLFEYRTGHAVNRGLYYVSMHYVLER